MTGWLFTHITLFKKFRLLNSLSGIRENFRAVNRECDFLCRTAEYFDTEIVFQLFHGTGKARLRNKKLFGNFGNRTASNDFYNIFQLLKCHKLN